MPSRNEPDLDGEINYPFVFYHIAKLGYKGWIGCEYHPRGKTLFLFSLNHFLHYELSIEKSFQHLK